MKKGVNCISLLMVLTILFMVGCGSDKSKSKESDQKPKDKQPAKVDGYVVTPSLLIDNITVTGTLLAFEEVELKNEMAGRVVELNLPEGKFVKKGTLLVKLFDDDLQANLKKFQTQLAIQEKIYQRQSELLKVNGISQSDYDQTYLQVNTIKAEIDVQKTQIRKSEVLAPFDGVIGLRNISVGAQITPSTLLATIRMEDKLKLDFSVPEKYSSEVKAGQKIKFTVHGTDKLFDATVLATEGGIEPTTRNLKIRALVMTKSEDLMPGSFANVQLSMKENKNAMLIPTQAIIPQERNKSVIVAKEGKAHFVVIHTGIRKESTIEVIDGINCGDTLVTTGLLFLREGAKISFSNFKKAAL